MPARKKKKAAGRKRTTRKAAPKAKAKKKATRKAAPKKAATKKVARKASAKKKASSSRGSAAKGKEQLVLIRPYRDGLILHQLFYAPEVRAYEDLDLSRYVHDARDFDADLVRDQVMALRDDPAEYWQRVDAALDRLSEEDRRLDELLRETLDGARISNAEDRP